MTKISVLILTVLTSLTLVTPVTSQTPKSNQAHLKSTTSGPTVTLSSSATTIAEAGGVSTITATLAQATNKPVLIDFSVEGTAKNKTDYQIRFSHYGVTRVAVGGNFEGSEPNQFAFAHSIFVDAQKNAYVTDELNNRVQKWEYGALTGETVATASSPAGLFVDSLGNVFVVDKNNHRVQKWAPGAAVGVTVAGGNGAGSGANQLNYPLSVFVDKSGNVYVVDNGRIQKWAPGATSGTTIMGINRKVLNKDFSPFDICGDKFGNIYVSDVTTPRVVKWNHTSNVIETVAGDNGFGNELNQLARPYGIAVDENGNLYVADFFNSNIKMWKPGEQNSTVIFAPGNISDPNDIFLDNDNNIYYTSIPFSPNVKKFQLSPQILIPAGQTTGTLTVQGLNDLNDEYDETILLTPTATNASLAAATPVSLTIIDDDLEPKLTFSANATTINENGGEITVTAALSRRSAKNIGFKLVSSGTATSGTDYTLSSDSLTIAAGDSIATFKVIAIDDSLIELSETIQINVSSSVNLSTPYPSLTINLISDDAPQVTLAASQTSFSEAGGKTTITASLATAIDREVVIDFTLSGDATEKDYTLSFPTKGLARTVAGGNGSGSAANQLKSPADIYVNDAGEMYIADAYNHRIQKWLPYASEGITVAGGVVKGTGLNQLAFPNDLFFDKTGNMYIADTENNRIMKWEPNALTGIKIAGGNGMGARANQLNNPRGVYVDSVGNIYIADTYNNRIQKWEPNSITGIKVAGENGAGEAAIQFNIPASILVDNNGDMIISDYENHRVQKWTPGAVSGVTIVGGRNIVAGRVVNPNKVFIDHRGNMFVAEYGGNKIHKIAPNASNSIIIFGGNGLGSAANQLNRPSGVHVDKYDNVYISDINNHRVQKIQYQAQIVIPAGQTTGTLQITGVNNAIDNEDKSLVLTVSSSLNVDASNFQPLNLTITDDELPPSISFAMAQTTINEESAGADVTVSLNRLSTRNIGFKLSTSGTAIKGVDYTLSSDSLVVPAGSTTTTFKIIPINDNIVEVLKTIQLSIASSVNASTTYPALTAYISSDDKPSIQLIASPTSFSEVKGSSIIKATLSEPTSRDIVVNITFSGTAQQNTDYIVSYTSKGTTSSPQMIIPAGQSTLTDSIKIEAIEDWLNEADESIIVNPTSANALFPDGAITLTIKDNSVKLTQQATPFPALTESAISWGDYDRDGDQDLAIMGTSLATGNVTRIYRNDNGVFVDANQNLFKLRNGDLQWVDINKDGFLDLLVSGIGSENGTTVRKTILYINNQGTFTATDDINVVGLSYTKLAFGDLDNDGDLDLAIMGKNAANQSLFYLYEKLDNQLKYQLIPDFNPVINVSEIVDGDLKIADFDLDGDNDILFKGGYVRNSYNETGNFGFALSYTDLRYEVTKLYNDSSPLTILGLGAYGGTPSYGANTYIPVISSNAARKNGAIAAGDFNNDGLTDILVTGENASSTGESKLFYQKSNGSFELSDIALAALRNSTADWVDYDVDGDLDLIMTGIHATNGQTTVLYKNDAGVKQNRPPSAPSNLQVTDLGNGFVKLSWDKPADDYSSFLGYNIRLGTTPGGTELSNPQSNLQTGSRLITAIPPIYTNSYITQLSPGQYYWSVQAIDQGFQGSPFAAEQVHTLQYDWKLINQRGIINRSISGVDTPRLTLLDIDNDNDLDLILGSKYNRQAYFFDGKIYRPATLNIGYGGIENLIEGDINNDGRPDLVINSSDKVLSVYLNTGGNFTHAYTASATGLINTKLKLADMDNDGLIDIMVAGITSTDDNGVPKFYRIEWQGSASNFVFSDLSSQIAPLKYASYDFGDFNKDSKIDFIASGYDENEGLKSILYQNTTVVDSELTLTPTNYSFIPVNQGTTDMVDYDGDGDLDIMFTGMIASGPDVFQVYENQLSGQNATFTLRTINIGSLRNAKIRFGDFNGDGLQDIFYTGFKDGTGKVTGLAQYNASTKNYVPSSFNYGNLTDAEFAFGDIENDGDLDIILAGSDVNNEYNKIFRALLNVQNESALLNNTNTLANSNNLANTSGDDKITLAAAGTYRFNSAPTVPKTKSLKLLTVSSKKILEFAWLAATDDNTPVSGLSYNLRIGKSLTGDEILTANADVNGVRKIAGKGNTEHNLSWNIKMLPDGTYYWSVQAIDASFIGSQFTTPQKFEIVNGQLKTYQPPLVTNSTFTISETILANALIGKVQATDPENDPLTYEIISGNTNNWFTINASGQITLKTKPAIFPTQIVLEVKVKDGVNEVIGTITIKFCESNFAVTQNLVSVTKTYKSSTTIQATNKISGASVVSYEAKKSVLLSPGFTADKGVTFSALINAGCNN